MVVESRLESLALECSGVDGLIREFKCAGMESPVITQNDFEILGTVLGNTGV
jgi:hypothetical protein